MRGGSYLVVRRARIALEHWERMNVAFQEQTFGRAETFRRAARREERVRSDRSRRQGRRRQSADPGELPCPARRAGWPRTARRILRRSYSYNDGANITAERWPPWRQGMEFDAGLVFICYQRDLRNGFIKIFEKMSRFDMMNQFVTNIGGGHFACPGGAAKGEFIGQRLFEAAS